MTINEVIKAATNTLNKLQSSNGYDVKSFNAGFLEGIEYLTQYNKKKGKKRITKEVSDPRYGFRKI